MYVKVVFIIIYLLTLAHIHAEEAEKSAHWQSGLQITFDNDVFNGQDDHYTNGLELWTTSERLQAHQHGPLPVLGRWLGNLPGQDLAERSKLQSLSVAQRMFTPSNLETTEPILDDIPYSGHLVLGLSASAQDAERLDAWGFQIGILGPAALAEESQELVHALTGSTEPQGWDNQLHNELLINLAYEHRWRWLSAKRGLWGMDSYLNTGAMLGNLITQAHAGLTVRFGRNIPDDFAMAAPFMGEQAIGSRSFSPHFDQSFSTYVFMSVDWAAIAHAAFWDGNLFRDSQSVSRDIGMQRVQIGIHQEFPVLAINVTLVDQTIPWDCSHGYDSERYGRLGIAFKY